MRLRSALLFAAMACAAFGGAAAEPPPASDAMRWSQAVLAAMRTGVVTSIDARLDDGMRAALPDGGLLGVFESLHKRVGVLRDCAMPSSRASAELTIVDYPCAFATGPQTVRLTWTSRGRLAGLFVLPAAVVAPLPANVREESIVTGAPGWALPGSLLMPPGDAARPVVVLVHGSGPNDRDETVGPNKPFRDLAIGFARQGIASLRYDKRTLVLGERFTAKRDRTLDDEIIDDAVAALAMASYRVGTGPVFIVGHSEGALLAPRIAAVAKERGVAIAGVVMIAAPITPLADLDIEQWIYLSRLPDTTVTPALLDDARMRRENLRALVAEAAGAAGRPAAEPSPPLPMNLPATVWLDLQRYDPAASLLDQPQLPALLVFGGRDYQVPIREMALWKARLGSRPRTTVIAFPAINHLMIDGSGPMTPVEYGRPGQVSGALIDAVSRWMLDPASRR